MSSAALAINQGHPVGTEIYVNPGDSQALTAAIQTATRNSSSTNQHTIRLLPGNYTLTAVLNCRNLNYVTIAGGGREATVIKRDTTLSAIALGNTDVGDPVLDLTGSVGVTLRDLSIVHSGTHSSTDNPMAASITNATYFKSYNCTFEGSTVGLWDFTDVLPIGPDGTEAYQVFLNNCRCVSHARYGATFTQREVFAFGCEFRCETVSTLSDSLSSGAVFYCGYRAWEFSRSYLYGCQFIARTNHAITQSGQGITISGLSSADTASSMSVFVMGGCCFAEAVGDVNGSGALIAAAALGGAENQMHMLGTMLQYKTPTGGLTACAGVGGFLIQASTNGAVQQAYLIGCKAIDMGGTGGTTRKDILTYRSSAIAATPDKLHIVGGMFASYGNAGTAPSANLATLVARPDSLIDMRSTAAFSSASTAAVTLPISYPLTAMSDYHVNIEPSAAESFWVTSKTNTGFTLNSSNAASTATIRYVVTR